MQRGPDEQLRTAIYIWGVINLLYRAIEDERIINLASLIQPYYVIVYV